MSVNSVILKNLPMPPRLSDCYTRGFRMFATKELKAYKRDMSAWTLVHNNLVRTLRRSFLMSSYLRVDRYFIFPYSKIIAQNGNAKALDATNRIKALDDALAEVLSFDDRYFSSGVCEKVVGTKETVVVVLTPTRMREENEVLHGETPRAITAAFQSEEFWNEPRA